MLPNRSKCKPIKVSLIQEHGVTITDSEDIANRFCQQDHPIVSIF